MSDQEKKKINRNRDKISEFVNPEIPQKKRKESLVQEGGALLAPLLAQRSFVGPLLKCIRGV